MKIDKKLKRVVRKGWKIGNPPKGYKNAVVTDGKGFTLLFVPLEDGDLEALANNKPGSFPFVDGYFPKKEDWEQLGFAYGNVLEEVSSLKH